MIAITATLNEVQTAYRNGTATESEVIDYIRRWNSGPHFTQAILRDGAIRNYDPERTHFSKAEREQFGIKL